jgi:hypothetical protein
VGLGETIIDIMSPEYDVPRIRDIAIGALANAEVAAKKDDESKTIEHLKSTGKWALSYAEKIGTGVAVAAIKFSLGI